MAKNSTLDEPAAAEVYAPAIAHEPAATSASSKKKTPREWALAKGMIPAPRFEFQEPVPDWRYAAADALYGWSHHAYHFQGEKDGFLLTEQDFDLGLAAAAQYPTVPPHEAAITDSCPHKAEFLRASEAQQKASRPEEKR